METRYRKQHERPGTWFDTVGRHQIVRASAFLVPLRINNQFPSPIGPPLFMEVRDQGDPAQRCPPAPGWMALIRIIMRGETISRRVGVVTESQMAPGQVRKRLDVVLDAGQLQSGEKLLALDGGNVGFRPIPGLGKILPHVGELAQAFPRSVGHRLAEIPPFLRRPEVFDDHDRTRMQGDGGQIRHRDDRLEQTGLVFHRLLLARPDRMSENGLTTGLFDSQGGS